MTTSWFDWTFFLVVLFPIPLSISAGAVWATWVCTRPVRPPRRKICRGAAMVLSAVCVVGTLASFASWWIGFDHVESPAGVPPGLDRVVDTGWATGMAGLFAVVALTIGCFVAHPDARHQLEAGAS